MFEGHGGALAAQFACGEVQFEPVEERETYGHTGFDGLRAMRFPGVSSYPNRNRAASELRERATRAEWGIRGPASERVRGSGGRSPPVEK
jgi:hypothetical protein